MATTWADIKRLAADLQRVQLLEGTKKLSEKNCVEVVSILIGSKAVDLVFTVDGQHYITKKHLLTEIKNECLGNGGRISLSALAQVLNVNYDVIESAVDVIVKQSSSYYQYNAELISMCYIDHLCSEINEQLTEVGALSISYLVKNWNLPFDLLNDHIFAKVGCKINATRDFDILYTQNYLSAQKNLIRAVVNALTKVTPVSKMIDSIGISPSLFWTLFDELLSCNEIPGKTIGSRNSSHIFYVPNIHTKLSRLFVTKTFAEHQLLELSILKKLSITDPLSFLKELLPESDFKSLIFLPSVIISEKLLKEIMENVENEVNAVNYADIRAHLPESISSNDDITTISSLFLKGNKGWFSSSDCFVFYNQQMLNDVMKTLDGFISEKAVKEVEELSKRQNIMKILEKVQLVDRTTIEKSKKGKSAKNKGQKQASKTEDVVALQLSEDELVQELTRIGGIPEDLYEDLVQRVIYDLKAVLIERVENLLHTARTNTSQNFKHAHIQMQEKIRNLYDSICVFEEGTSCFDDAVSANLKSYLLRTLCTDVAYTILSAMTGSNLSNTTSPKIRDECIANINSIDGRRSFTKLFLSLTGSDLNNFHSALLEVSAMNICSINLKLPDKKKRVELVETYASELERQLMSCEDAASGLLVALLLLIARNCNLAVHASGKFVSHLIAKVEMFQNVSANLFECLIKTQKYVILSLRQKNDELAPLMAENLKNLKDFILKK